MVILVRQDWDSFFNFKDGVCTNFITTYVLCISSRSEKLGLFGAVYNYEEKAGLNKVYWYPKRKLGSNLEKIRLLL